MSSTQISLNLNNNNNNKRIYNSTFFFHAVFENFSFFFYLFVKVSSPCPFLLFRLLFIVLFISFLFGMHLASAQVRNGQSGKKKIHFSLLYLYFFQFLLNFLRKGLNNACYLLYLFNEIKINLNIREAFYSCLTDHFKDRVMAKSGV